MVASLRARMRARRQADPPPPQVNIKWLAPRKKRNHPGASIEDLMAMGRKSPVNKRHQPPRAHLSFEPAEEMQADGWACDYTRAPNGNLSAALPIGYTPKE